MHFYMKQRICKRMNFENKSCQMAKWSSGQSTCYTTWVQFPEFTVEERSNSSKLSSDLYSCHGTCAHAHTQLVCVCVCVCVCEREREREKERERESTHCAFQPELFCLAISVTQVFLWRQPSTEFLLFFPPSDKSITCLNSVWTPWTERG